MTEIIRRKETQAEKDARRSKSENVGIYKIFLPSKAATGDTVRLKYVRDGKPAPDLEGFVYVPEPVNGKLLYLMVNGVKVKFRNLHGIEVLAKKSEEPAPSPIKQKTFEVVVKTKKILPKTETPENTHITSGVDSKYPRARLTLKKAKEA